MLEIGLLFESNQTYISNLLTAGRDTSSAGLFRLPPNKLPVNATIASEVARTGLKVNLRNLPAADQDAESSNSGVDDAFYVGTDKQEIGMHPVEEKSTDLACPEAAMDQEDTAITENPKQQQQQQQQQQYDSFMCMAIRAPDDKVLGVISLIDKEGGAAALDGGGGGQVSGRGGSIGGSGGGVFSANDEYFVEAFSIFCGMAIRNAAEYEKAVVSEAKLQVAGSKTDFCTYCGKKFECIYEVVDSVCFNTVTLT